MVKPCDQLIADDIRSYAATGQPDRPLVSVQTQNAITQGVAELIESDGEEFSEEIADALEETRHRKERFFQGMRVAQQQLAAMVETLPARVSFADYFQRTAGATVERFAHRAGVLDACRERGIAGLLKIRSVGAAVGIALSFAYGQTFEVGRTPPGTQSIYFMFRPRQRLRKSSSPMTTVCARPSSASRSTIFA